MNRYVQVRSNNAKRRCYTIDKFLQTADGEEAAIVWRVLEVERNKALVAFKYALGCLRYNKEFEPNYLEKYTLRSSLNDEFFDKAFTEEEKQEIVKDEVSADRNPMNKKEQGPATEDRVFLLSVKKSEELYDGDDNGICFPTPYANKVEVGKGDKSGACNNWLRTIGGSEYGATAIIIFGTS